MAIIERPVPAVRRRADAGRAPPPCSRATACSAARCRPPVGARGCSRSTTSGSASCTASPRCSSSSSAASRRWRSAPSSPGPTGTLLSASTSTTRCSRCTRRRWSSSSRCRLAAAFGNYFLPLQIGARDVAFPRINAFGFWSFLFGALFVNASWFLGGAADGGWFMYAPNSSVPFSPSHGIDFWTLGLQITGIASLTGAINLIVTVLNMRTKGMSLMRMPVFTWMILVIQFLLLFAIPVITVALFLLMFQRQFDATFFSRRSRRRPAAVAAPVLDLRSPRGVHPRAALLRHRVRGAAGVLEEAAVRLPVRRVLRRGDRLRRLGRVGAPHVRLRPRADQRRRVLGGHDGDRHPDRRQDRQLDAHDVGRQAHLHHGDAVRRSVWSSSSRSAASRASPTRWRRRTPSRPTPTTSSPTSTTCCSAAPCSASSPASTTGGRRCSASASARRSASGTSG